MVRDSREETNDFRVALDREVAPTRDNWEPLLHHKSIGFCDARFSRYFEIRNREQIRIYPDAPPQR
jgi:hypothetical protein